MQLLSGSYQVCVLDSFESAHFLYKYVEDGSDEPIHGHTWKVEVLVFTSKLENGIAMDFVFLQKKLHALCQELDHKLLNSLEIFQKNNPTAENVARYFYTRLKNEVLPPAGIREIKIWEGPICSVSFFPEKAF